MQVKLHRYLLGAARTNYPVQWARTSCGRALDWIRGGNFLLLSSVRSGTTLMVDYLNCSRSIRCYGEILGPGHIQYGYPYRMSPDRLRLHVESFFVKRPGMLVGAKIMTFHLDELPIRLADMLDMLGRPKVIVLYRANTLQQYASLRLAQHHGVWHVKRAKNIGPIRLDPDDFLAFAQRERRMWRENLAVLEGNHVHRLSYEQLASRPECSMRAVFDYLDVRPRRIRSRFVRTNSQPLWQKVMNYREFVDRGIPDAAMLDLSFSTAQQPCVAAA